MILVIGQPCVLETRLGTDVVCRLVLCIRLLDHLVIAENLVIGNGGRHYWRRDCRLCEVTESHFCLRPALLPDLSKDALFSTQVLHDLEPTLLLDILERLLHADFLVNVALKRCFLVSDCVVGRAHVVMARVHA